MGRRKKKPADEDAEGDANEDEEDGDGEDGADEEVTPSLIGRKVLKEFKGFGIFSGKVVSYSSARRFYKIVYDDGDREELDINEIRQILVGMEETSRLSSRKRAIRDTGNDFITPKRQKREVVARNTASTRKSSSRSCKLGSTPLSSRNRLNREKEEAFVLETVLKNGEEKKNEKTYDEKHNLSLSLLSLRKRRKSEVLTDSPALKSLDQQKAEESSVSDAEGGRSDRDGNGDCDGSDTDESDDFDMDGCDEEENDSDSCSSSDESSSVVRRRKKKTKMANVVLPELIPLPHSSCDIAISEDLVLETFAIYSVLRSFSLVLFLSPFGLDEFVAALTGQTQNNLVDSIHLVLLQALRRHLQRLAKEGHKESKECLRKRDWNLLDNVTWPSFVLVFLATHRFGKMYGKTLAALGLLDSEYYKVCSKTKLEVLGFLCDQVMETEEIRAVMDIRELQFTSQVRQKERNVLRRGAYLSTNIESTGTKEHQADDVPQMNENLSSKITVNETKLMQGEISKHTNNDECMLCGMEGNLICCDGCPGAYHSRCVGISRASLPPGDWFCPECIVEKDGGEVCKRINGLKGSRTIGIDPYGRTFLYACGHLLVLESTSFTESSYKYYNKDDVPRVLQSLDMLKPHCDKIAKSIRQIWELPLPCKVDASSSAQSPNPEKLVNTQDSLVMQITTESSLGDQKESESGSVIMQITLPKKPINIPSNLDSAMTSHDDAAKVDPEGNMQSEPCVVNSAQVKPLIASIPPDKDGSSVSGSSLSTVDPENKEDTLIDDKKPLDLQTVKTEGGASNSLEGTVNSTATALRATSPPPSIVEQIKQMPIHSNEDELSTMKKRHPYYEHQQVEHLRKAMSYMNRYVLGDVSATAAANLTLATGDQNAAAKGLKKKKVVTTIAEQVNAFLKSLPHFCWPSMKKKLVEIPKERCGWCFSCLSSLKRGCLMNQAFGQLAAGAANVSGGIKPTKCGEGHLPGVAGYLLHMEESVHSLLQGPWENLQYRKLWRRKLEQASSVAEVRHALLNFEAHLRTVVLTEDWSKRLEDAPTFFIGGCSSSTLNDLILKKTTNNKRGARSGLARRRPKNRGTPIGVVQWIRRGKLAYRVTGWATLPSKVVRKAGRHGGLKRISGITYAEEEEVPKRSRQVAWRARVDAACTVAELAVQVRCLDALFRWADLLSKVDVVPLLNNVADTRKSFIRAKEMKGSVSLYLVPSRLIQNQSARQCIPTANQVGKDFTPTTKDHEIWVDERQVPLCLLKEFEERERLSRQSKATKVSILQKQYIDMRRQTRNDFVKCLWERAGYTTATKLVMSVTCKYCKEKVVTSSAVQCHLCQEPFHKDCTVTSYGEASGQMKNTCCGCLKTPAKIVSASNTNVRQRSPYSVEALKDRNFVTVHDLESRKSFISQTPRPQPKVTTDSSIALNSISRHAEKNAFEAVSWKQNEVYSRMRIEKNMILPLKMKEQVFESPKCFICQMHYRHDQLYIKCEFCPLWFHGAAFGITQSNAAEVSGFKCHKCRKKGMPSCPYGTKCKIQKLIMQDCMLAEAYSPPQEDVVMEGEDISRAKRTPLTVAVENHHPAPLDSRNEARMGSRIETPFPMQSLETITQVMQVSSSFTANVQNVVVPLPKPVLSFTELLSSEDNGVEQLDGFGRDFDLDGFDVFNVDALMGTMGTTHYPEAEAKISAEEMPQASVNVNGGMIENFNHSLELKAVPCAVCSDGSIPSNLQCAGCGSVVHQECLASDSAAWSWTCQGWACNTCKARFSDHQGQQIFSGFDACGG